MMRKSWFVQDRRDERWNGKTKISLEKQKDLNVKITSDISKCIAII